MALSKNLVSQHIQHRIHTTQTPTLLRPTTSAASATSGTSDDRPAHDKFDNNHSNTRSSIRSDTGSSPATKAAHRKGISLISRIIDRTKKKDTDEDVSSTLSDAQSDLRPEGMEAEVFSQPVSNFGYEPKHAQPPAYIRVRSKYKKERDFDRLFLAQELEGCSKEQPIDDTTSLRSVRSRRSASSSRQGTNANNIWAMQFSKDGKYLAAAGHDRIVRVWAVISSSADRRRESVDEQGLDQPDPTQMRLSAPVFHSKPIREYEGHTASVLDLTWSKNNFLLSSSMDKTVRLWHVSRDDCLCTFKHNDFVTSIAFHPLDDRFFLAGSLDAKLRLWSIPDKTVAYWSNLGDMVTAVEFTPDGKYAIGGCLNGLCMFYETEGLRYQTQMHVRSARGKNAKGSKITKIQAITYPPNSNSGITKLLITSNDSRIRLYNFRDKSLEIKFKGNVNDNSQIRATFSDDAGYIICGSEDSKAYIWTMSLEDGEKGQKRPLEYFTASNTITTCAIFAPAKTRQLLGRSKDPVYDICNPPPVTLMSREEAESRKSSATPTDDDGVPPETEAQRKKPEESPAYIARSTHKTGNIIVTADSSGHIKVFRQDCAWAKRNKDSWETSSVFNKASSVRRTASIATRGSSRSLRSVGGSVRTQAPSERIVTWRQGLDSAPSVIGSRRSSKNGAGTTSVLRNSTSQLSLRSNRTQSRSEAATGTMGPPPVPKLPPGNMSPTSANKRGDAAIQNGQPPPSDANLHKLRADVTDTLGQESSLHWLMAKDSAVVHQTQYALDNDENEAGVGGRQQLTRNPTKASTLSIDRSDYSGSEGSNDEFMDALDTPHNHHRHDS